MHVCIHVFVCVFYRARGGVGDFHPANRSCYVFLLQRMMPTPEGSRMSTHVSGALARDSIRIGVGHF